MGGKWGVRDAVEYMLTADFAILDLASTRSSSFLHKAWEMARSNIEAGQKGQPFAYIVPSAQWDKSSSIELLRRQHAGKFESASEAKTAGPISGKLNTAISTIAKIRRTAGSVLRSA